jgi:thymidylate synthase (FAD)
VPDNVGPRVQLVAWTQFQAPAGIDWQTDATGGQALAEFAGRACYQAWDKTNPVTASNAGYLHHIVEVGHLSVLEHSSVSFYLTGISRSVGSELVRHRHFSFSQLSQRYQVESDATMVEPAAVAADPALHARFVAATEAAVAAYAELLESLQSSPSGAEQPGLRRKQARQAARSVLPNATETKLVMTGNFRAWRHFLAMRGAEHADAEIRALAISCLVELRRLAPNVFADFTVTTLADGSQVASSPMAWEG